MDVSHTTGCSPDPTRSAPPRQGVLAGSSGAPREPLSVEGALRERMRLAALGADVGVALTQGESLPDMLRRTAEAVVRHLCYETPSHP